MPESIEVQRALIARAINEDHTDMVLMSAKIDKLTADVETLMGLVKESGIQKMHADHEKLMELFQGAKGVVRIVTWVGGIAGVLAAMVAAMAPYFTFNHAK